MSLCQQGTQQVGDRCQACDLNTYSLNGSKCLNCPEGQSNVMHATLGFHHGNLLLTHVFPPENTAWQAHAIAELALNHMSSIMKHHSQLEYA